jgi:uncharacterized protein (TIGR03437 family)
LVTVIGADLGGRDSDVAVSLRDSSGAERSMHLLYSGPGQLNSILPDDARQGDATLVVRRNGWPDASATVKITPVSPGMFTVNQAGLGLLESPGFKLFLYLLHIVLPIALDSRPLRPTLNLALSEKSVGH